MAESLQKRAATLRPALAPAAVASIWPFVVAVALALALQFFVKPLLGDFYSKVALDIGTNVILAVSLTMVNGFTGQFSLGHAAFMLVGGYTAAMIVYYGSMLAFGDVVVHGGRISSMLDGRTAEDGSALPFVTPADLLFLGALLVGGVVSAACGYLVGLPSLRLKGDYLAIVTLGFGEIVRVLVQSQTKDVVYDVDEVKATPVIGIAQLFHEPAKNWGAFFSRGGNGGVDATDWIAPLWLKVGGALGFSGLPTYSNLFWVWLFAFVTLLFAFRVKRSSLGRAFLSIREDEIAAEAMGVNTTKYKVKAFVIAAFFAGVAGGLFAHTIGVQLNPGELGFMKSFDIIIMVVLGGLGSISGAAVAAAVLSILPELLRDPPSLWPWGWVVVGVLAIALAAALPRGRKWRVPCIILSMAAVWELMRFGAKSVGINLADYRMVLYALLLIIMMIARPAGLLGVREIWEPGLWREAFGRKRKEARA